MEPEAVTYRAFEDRDKDEVHRLARQVFGRMVGIVFGFEQGGHVAEHKGRIVGATVLKKFRQGESTFGVLSWIMVASDQRGAGVGQRLIDLALAWFAQEACSQIVAVVEGYNQSSSKLFLNRGFDRLTIGAQLRRFGLGFLPLWLRIPHLLSIGHFIWHRADGVPAPRERPGLQWITNYLVHILAFGALAWRIRLSAEHSWQAIALALLLVPLVLLSVRTIVQKGVALALGLQTTYRLWDAGLVLSLLVAAIFGGILISPGSLYPASESYRYRDELRRIGPMHFGGVVAILLLSASAQAALLAGVNLGIMQLSVLLFLSAARFFVIYELLLIVFPFTSFAGRHIMQWSPVAWWFLALPTVTLLVLSFLA